MEQLVDAILNVVKATPSIAVWVLVIIYGFKVAVVGSIFGVIRLGILKLHNYMVTPKHELKVMQVEARFKSVALNDIVFEDLMAQILRIRRTELKYIHEGDVQWLRKAIDAHFDTEPANTEKKTRL